LARQTNTDPKTFVFDIDSFRTQNPIAAQDIIRDPSKYYRITKNYLEKSMLVDENSKKKYEAKI
jgi:hypothetical protein